MEMPIATVDSQLFQFAARPPKSFETLKDVRVHFVSLAACAKREEELVKMLSQSERDRAWQINDPGRRIAFVASRAMLRQTLSDFVDQMVTPGEWVFETGPYGKPKLLFPGQPAPHFSLSYTPDILVIAISQLNELGVDLEAIPYGGKAEVPWQVLNSAERRAIGALPVYDQFVEFLRMWTLKEAYTKYYGYGAALDFRGVQVDLDQVRATASTTPRDERLAEPLLHQEMMTVGGRPFVFALASGQWRR